MSAPIIAVTGITGQQGGAVAKKLLALGCKVRGITRNTSSPSATKWSNQGVEMVAADMKDSESFKKALDGATSMFLVTQVHMFNSDNEYKEGKNAIDAAKAAGVNDIVYSAVGNASNAPQVPHFASKHKVEQYIQSNGFKYTFVRPAFFMENYSPTGQMPAMAPKDGVIKGLIPGDVKLQMVATEDIGNVAAIALSDRDKYAGRTIELSGDELTGDEMAATLTKVTGKPYKYSYWGVFRYFLRYIVRDMAHMADFFVSTGYAGDIPQLRKEFPDLQTWEQWVTKNKIGQ
ncbi:hypothetical protein BC940DRAFT_313553 [Gongronella butleri]|nr:hypothetical protein BC940DRAFT_313553 [Gongronella butleri]